MAFAHEILYLTLTLLAFLTGLNFLSFALSKGDNLRKEAWLVFAAGLASSLILCIWSIVPLIALVAGSLFAAAMANSVTSKELKPNLLKATVIVVKFKNDNINSINSFLHLLLSVLIAVSAILILAGF